HGGGEVVPAGGGGGAADRLRPRRVPAVRGGRELRAPRAGGGGGGPGDAGGGRGGRGPGGRDLQPWERAGHPGWRGGVGSAQRHRAPGGGPCGVGGGRRAVRDGRTPARGRPRGQFARGGVRMVVRAQLPFTRAVAPRLPHADIRTVSKLSATRQDP